MSRLIVGLLAAAGGLIIGSVGGRKKSNITFKDVKATPGKVMSGISNAVKKTGEKVSSGLSTLAFWKKKKEVKEKKVNHEKNYQDLSVKYGKLSDDFSTTVKRMNITEAELTGTAEQLRQANEKNETYQNTFTEKDEKLTKAVGDKNRAEADLKAAQNTIKKMEKAALKAE
jgi:chromosome segregation ATPase